MELLVAMVSDRMTAEELALLTRLFLEKTPPTVSANLLISEIRYCGPKTLYQTFLTSLFQGNDSGLKLHKTNTISVIKH